MGIAADDLIEFVLEKALATCVIEHFEGRELYEEALHDLVRDRDEVSEKAMDIIEKFMRVPFFIGR
jgi:hypothetical protein